MAPDGRRTDIAGGRIVMAAAAAVLMLAALGPLSAAQRVDRQSGDDRAEATPRGLVPLQFHSERIRIEIRGDSVEIDGLYRFLCTRSRRPAMTLLFPYPQDSMLGGAQTAVLEEILPDAKTRKLRFEELSSDRGALWYLDVPERDTLVVRTVYRQHLHGCFARYVVTTTGFWQHPLAHARFEVHVPDGVEAPSFSHPFRRKPRSDSGTWFYEAWDFRPEKDIEIRWDCSR